jgi:PKD repeat protein
MNLLPVPKPCRTRIPLLALKPVFVFVALCLTLTIGAAAQSGPVCGVGLSTTSGTAPLTVTATGGCSDATGTITAETLDWGDGTQIPISSAQFGAFSLQHTYTSAGTFNVVLSATDSNGVLGQTAPQPVVVSANQPPSCTLSVTPTSGTAPLGVSASGNCSDPENDITSTVITWGDGASSNGTSGTHTYTSAGTFTVTLTATDSANNHGSATQTVTVQGNQPPTCTLTVNPTSGNIPLTVNAGGTCTDPENDIVSTVLNWGDGTSTSAASGTHTYTVAGHYTVTVTATDSGGLTGSASQKVDAHKQNQPPTCALSVAPNAGPAPLAVGASGNCTDPENDIVSTILDWGDHSPPVINKTTGTHTYTVVGTYTVKLTATDSAGNVAAASQTVTVGSGHNAPPTCAMTVSPSSGQVPFSVTVTPACTDPENDITLITIDFGDSFYTTVGPGATTSHTYTRSGAFSVVVKATDIAGNVSNAASQTVKASDVATEFVGIGNGQIKQFDQNGKVLKSFATNQSGSLTGMAFDWLDSLYVTDFSADTVSKFNGNGTLIGTFGSGYNCKPESIVFDNAGNAYVGETGCSHALLKFDAYGNLAAAYTLSTEVEGSDWIDLAADQCTIYYTSQGNTVFRFNACTGQQQPPFANGLTTGLAVKILGDGSVLVADKADIVHFDAGGHVITKFTASGETCLVSLALDPDGKTFWALDYCTSDVLRFDISSGSQVAKFSSGAAAQTAYGIGMRGPAPSVTPAGPLLASPENVTISAGQSASFTIAFVPSSSAVGQNFSFSCANLPVGAQCKFTPQSASVSSAGLTLPVTITTAAASQARVQFPGAQKLMALWTLPVGLLFAGDLRWRRRSRKRMWLRLVFMSILLSLLMACSASSSNSGGNNGGGNNSAPTPTSSTPAGSYSVVVHATAKNGLQSSTMVSLAVQ